MPKMAQRECEYCTAVFFIRATEIARNRGKFCSTACRNRMYAPLQKHADMQGEQNPNWKGGISHNKYHYKKLQMQRYPERVKARTMVSRAIRSGKLVRGDCSKCGLPQAQAHHHRGYSDAFDFIWLCAACHRLEHQSERG